VEPSTSLASSTGLGEADAPRRAAVLPQSGAGECACGGGSGREPVPTAPSFVYALGQIEPRCPTLSVEKELAQATGRAETKGLTDRQAMHEVLSKRENRYLARQLCWVFTVGGLETYLLRPRDPADFDLLLEALRRAPRPTDVDVVIGLRGPVAPPDYCNGLTVPIVAFDQIYSFDTEALIKAVPRPERIDPEKFAPIAEELFRRVLQMADNAGATDEHRAVNYLAVRYDAIYARAAEMYQRDFALSAVDARPSPLGSPRKIVDVIFCFNERSSDFAEKYSVRVDVTEEFPFLVTKLGPYFDR
jgi:hypothetical protein